MEELEQTAGTMVFRTVSKGGGCAIYSTRPDECRRFRCGYLLWPALGEHWLPAPQQTGRRVEAGWQWKSSFTSIPARPLRGGPNPTTDGDSAAWLDKPSETAHTLFVQIGRRMIAIFPDREVDLGIVAEDETNPRFGDQTGRLGSEEAWRGEAESGRSPDCLTFRSGTALSFAAAAPRDPSLRNGNFRLYSDFEQNDAPGRLLQK